jgi:hypothetical protein
MTACRDQQLSYIGQGALSLFTQALVDGLRGEGTRGSGGYVSAFDLDLHLYDSVKEAAQEYGKTQEPELTVLKGAGPFAVSLFRGATSLGDFDSTAPPPEGTAVCEVSPERARSRLRQFHLQIGDSYRAKLSGDGAIAQGNGAIAPGKGAVQVGGKNTGNINTGTQIDTRITTGGGAVIAGAVATRGGHVIGRDYVEHLTQVVQVGEDPEEAKSVVALYLHALVADLAGLRLGEIDLGAQETGREPLQLADFYVPLDTRMSIPRGGKLGEWLSRGDWDRWLNAPEGRDKARPVSALEALDHHRELTLLGKPGSGKSTFGASLLLAMAQAWQGHRDVLAGLGETWTHGGLFPIRVLLRRFAERLPSGDGPAQAGDLWDFIAADLRATGYGMSERTIEYVQRIARTGGALMLLDGLDECGSGSGTTQQRVLAAVRELMRSAGPKCRFLLTARPYAWPGGPDPRQGVYALADIGEGRLLRAFKPLLNDSLDKAAIVVEYIENRAGLLIGQGEKDGEPQFAFPHRTFQEFLAACYLAAQDDFPAECARLARHAPDHWQVVLALAARVARTERGASAADELIGGAPVAELRKRRQPEPADWTCAMLAGQQLQEIGLVAITKRERTRAIADRVCGWIADLLPVHPHEGGLHARQRAVAGDLLARLGDPRFDPRRFYLPGDDLLGFVHLPADPGFRIGTRKAHAERVREIVGDDFGEAEINDEPTPTADFYIARYPVTVAQLQAFVEAKGFALGDSDALRDPDNRPARLVNWHEALAYCDWLNEMLAEASTLVGTTPAHRVREQGWQVALPSELEWEKAARSHRLRLGKHPGAELRGQITGGQQIDGDAQDLFQLDLQAAQLEQGGTGQGIDQQIEVAAVPVAAVPVGAVQDRPEDAGIRRAEATRRLADGAAFRVERNRRFHGVFPSPSSLQYRRTGIGFQALA